MTSKEIRKALIDADLTAAEIARRIDITPTGVSHVIHGRRKSRWIREAIALALDMPYSVLWGESWPGPSAAGAPGVRKRTTPTPGGDSVR